MRIFQDFFTETEIISDSYPCEILHDGAVWEIRSRMIVPGEVNVDVGCGNAFGGKNEDEEEGGAGGAPVEKVVDLIDAFGYQSTSLEKADWQKSFKAFVGRILAKKTENKESAEAIAKFKAGAGAYVKHVSAKWDDLEIWTAKDYDLDNSIIFSYWKNEEDEAPTFIYYMDGFKSYKV